MMPNLPNLPIPEVIRPDTFCLCLQIPNDPTWKQAFVNLLAIPTYWFNWDRDAARSGRELAAYWTELFDQIDWSTMSCCCNQPPIIFRFTVDGILQMSTDGGVTWTDAPGYDPRNNSPQFPPMTGDDGSDKRCLAATGAADLIKQQVGDELTDDMSQYTLAELFRDWENTVVNDGGNILDALLRLAANQVFALGVAALRAALTDEVYTTLKCILYCRMADDASFNDAALDLAESDITGMIGGIAGLFINHLIGLIGASGLTNLARSNGATTGDCSGCDCGDDSCATNTNADEGNFDLWTLPTSAMLPDDYNNLVRRVDDVDHPTIFLANGYSTMPFEQIGIIRAFDPPCHIGTIHIDASGGMPGRLLIGIDNGSGMTLVYNNLQLTTPDFPDYVVDANVVGIQIQYTSAFPQIHAINFI